MRANKFLEQNTQVRPLHQNEINLREKNTVIQKRLEPSSQELLRPYKQLGILTANFQRIAFRIIWDRPQVDPNYEKLIKGAYFLQGSIATITKKLLRIQDILQNLISFGSIQLQLIPIVIVNEELAVLYRQELSEEKKALGIRYKTSPGYEIFAPKV